MAERKGNLMTMREDIRVVDATIRDGGLCNDFHFTDEFVRELYKTNVQSGVDYMEFGYKASKRLFDVNDYGKWKFCDEESIRSIVGENVSDMKLCVMADVGRTDFRQDFPSEKRQCHRSCPGRLLHPPDPGRAGDDRIPSRARL